MSNYVIGGLLYLLGGIIFAVHDLNAVIELAKNDFKELPVIAIAFIYAVVCCIWPIAVISRIILAFLLLFTIKKKN